jgi:hypothetical protein
MNIKHTTRISGYFLLVGLTILLITAFRVHWTSPVKGSITPDDASDRAWLFSRTDTFYAPVTQGNFMITNVKSGTYILRIEGKPPYRDSFKEDVVVVDGQPTDVGVIDMYK